MATLAEEKLCDGICEPKHWNSRTEETTEKMEVWQNVKITSNTKYAEVNI